MRCIPVELYDITHVDVPEFAGACVFPKPLSFALLPFQIFITYARTLKPDSLFLVADVAVANPFLSYILYKPIFQHACSLFLYQWAAQFVLWLINVEWASRARWWDDAGKQRFPRSGNNRAHSGFTLRPCMCTFMQYSCHFRNPVLASRDQMHPIGISKRGSTVEHLLAGGSGPVHTLRRFLLVCLQQ